MNRRLRVALAALSLAFAAFGLFGVGAGFEIAWRPLVQQSALVSALGLTWYVYTRLKRPPALTLALEAALFAIILSSTFSFPMFFLARVSGAPRDVLLRRCDHAFGLDVPALVALTRSHPLVALSFERAYQSLHLVSVGALLLPALLSRATWVSELLLALALSAALSLGLLAEFPAVGPWSGDAFPPSAAQAECQAVLRAIARGASVSIDVRRSAPLIALPSWHVILAVLSAQTLGRFARLRWLAAGWAALVVLSTLATGWHYGVDVVAGLIVAALALGISRWVHQRWEHADRRSPCSWSSASTTRTT